MQPPINYTHIPSISCFYSSEITPQLSAPEAHYGYEMILVTGGSGVVFINQKSYPIRERSLIFLSRLETHSFHVTSRPYCRFVATMSAELILFNIKDVELVSVFIERPANFRHVIELNDQAYEMLLTLFERMRGEYARKDAFFESRMASIMVAILIDLYRTHPEAFPLHARTTVTEAVVNAQRYINDHFSGKVSLEAIARENFVSRHALSQAFKEITGTPFREYLIQYRISEAKKLLITTDLSVGEIAERVGYVNVNNFLKVFRDREGITPLKYRKSLSRKD